MQSQQDQSSLASLLERLEYELRTLRAASTHGVTSLQGQASTVRNPRGHHYVQTNVTGGTVFQGDVYGSVQIFNTTNVHPQISNRDRTSNIDALRRSSLGPPGSVSRTEAVLDKAQESFQRILQLSLEVSESVGEARAKRALGDLNVLLTNLLESRNFAISKAPMLCDDHMDELLHRSGVVFDLSKELYRSRERDYVQSSSLGSLSASHEAQPPSCLGLAAVELPPKMSGRCVPSESRDSALPMGLSSTVRQTLKPRSGKASKMQWSIPQHRLARTNNTTSMWPMRVVNLTQQSHMVSWQTEQGQIDLWTASRTAYSAANAFEEVQSSDPTETFKVTVTVTPRQSNKTYKQLVFCGSTIRSSTSLSILPPSLTVRNTRPFSSDIFATVGWGTVRELQQILVNGRGSIGDCNPVGETLLWNAITHGNVAVAEFLLEHGADVDVYAETNGTAIPMLSLALPDCFSSTKTRQQFTSCANLLIRRGADPFMKGISQDFLAVEFLSQASVDTVRCMLDSGWPSISANHLLGRDESPLIFLSARHSLDIWWIDQIPDKIELLLSRGADPLVRSEKGRTCLHEVMRYESGRYVRHRVYQNLVSAKHDGELKDILLLLLTAGADPYARDHAGSSVSDHAYRWGHGQEWKEALAECGYDVDEVINMDVGYTAWSSSAEMKHQSLLSFDEYLEIRRTRHLEDPYEYYRLQNMERASAAVRRADDLGSGRGDIATIIESKENRALRIDGGRESDEKDKHNEFINDCIQCQWEY